MPNKTPYEQWKQQLDTYLFLLSGLDSDGIADWHYAIAYKAGMPYYEAAKAALKANRLF